MCFGTVSTRPTVLRNGIYHSNGGRYRILNQILINKHPWWLAHKCKILMGRLFLVLCLTLLYLNYIVLFHPRIALDKTTFLTLADPRAVLSRFQTLDPQQPGPEVRGPSVRVYMYARTVLQTPGANSNFYVSQRSAWQPNHASETHFTKVISIAIQIRRKICLTVIPFMVMISLQCFAHVTTAQLSCHVQNIVAIAYLEIG